MSANEDWYDTEIAPALLALATRCNGRGMSFLASVEYDQGKRASTSHLTNDAGLGMVMLWHCAKADQNIDAYVINLIRHCRRESIDTSASIVMNRWGAPTSAAGASVGQTAESPMVEKREGGMK